jgi:hypothetical protein
MKEKGNQFNSFLTWWGGEKRIGWIRFMPQFGLF